MKAKELAEQLMEHPEAEVVVSKEMAPGVMAADRVVFGYFTRQEGGFYYGLHDPDGIEPNDHPVVAVLVE